MAQKLPFVVHFSTGKVRIDAYNEDRAKILAQAKRIKESKSYSVDRVEQLA